MIREFEKYHGVVLRELVVASGVAGVELRTEDHFGRVNSFLVNNHVGLHIKHSGKRLPPWQFTFDYENCSELAELAGHTTTVVIALVCGIDGFVCVPHEEFLSMTDDCGATAFLRVDRDKRSMYRVHGNKPTEISPKARGFQRLEEIFQRNLEGDRG